MLAPPPEGTFDIDNEILPLKGAPKADGPPEQVPLLIEEKEVTSTDTNTSMTQKVRMA